MSSIKSRYIDVRKFNYIYKMKLVKQQFVLFVNDDVLRVFTGDNNTVYSWRMYLKGDKTASVIVRRDVKWLNEMYEMYKEQCIERRKAADITEDLIDECFYKIHNAVSMNIPTAHKKYWRQRGIALHFMLTDRRV